jgi:hypothetical protein
MGADRDVVSRTTPAALLVPVDASATTATNARSRKGKGSGTGLNDLFIIIFGVAFLLSVSLNLLHSSGAIPHEHNTAIDQAMQDFKSKRPSPISSAGKHFKEEIQVVKVNPVANPVKAVKGEEAELHHQEQQEQQDPNGDPPELHLGDPVLSTLNCDAFGGPPQESAQEMVWWADIPSDANYISPFYDAGVKRYMTFEPDGGGWNNIRMAMESVIGLAVSMGRTLVMVRKKVVSLFPELYLRSEP